MGTHIATRRLLKFLKFEAYVKLLPQYCTNIHSVQNKLFSSGVDFTNRNCGHAVKQQDMLSSLKLHNSVRALLVEYSVAAFSATDHVSLFQGVFSPAVAANVRHAWVSVGASVHDHKTRGIKGSVPML